MLAKSTRRQAMQAATMGFLGLNLSRSISTATQIAPERHFTVDLVCGNLGVRATQPEAIAYAQEFGFESVAPDPSYLAGLSEEQLAELVSGLKGRGLAWGAAALEVDFRGEEERFQTGLKLLPAAAEALRRAGARRVGTWIRPTHTTLTYSANFRQHMTRLREIASVLGDHDVRLGLEYVGPKTAWTAEKYPFVHTLAETRELIEAIDRGNVGLVLDSWHWYTAGDTVASLLALRNDDVVACDLNDAPAGIPVEAQRDSVRKLPCETGVINLAGFLNALVKIGYDGPVRAEPFDAELRKLAPREALSRTASAMRQAMDLIGKA